MTGGDNIISTGNGNDILGLGNGVDTVNADDGNNTIYMAEANGTNDGSKDIVTGIGSDWVQTGSGDDYLNLGTNAGGASGFDIAFGGGGSDTFVLNEGSGWLAVGDFVQGVDKLSGIAFEDIESVSTAQNIIAAFITVRTHTRRVPLPPPSPWLNPIVTTFDAK